MAHSKDAAYSLALDRRIPLWLENVDMVGDFELVQTVVSLASQNFGDLSADYTHPTAPVPSVISRIRTSFDLSKLDRILLRLLAGICP